MKPLKDILNKPFKTLYVSRAVQNTDDLIRWATDQGFKTTLNPKDIHVTIAHSSKKVDWRKIQDELDNLVIQGGKREIKPLGDKGAVVLMFESPELNKRWKDIVKSGASWDYLHYNPHVSITYDGYGVDISKMTPYEGPILLGPETHTEVVEDFDETIKELDTVPRETKDLKFLIVSTFGETLDLAVHLSKVEKYETMFCTLDPDYDKIGEGIVEKTKNWWECLGQDYIWAIDGCETAEMQDWLREMGEYVVGTNKEMAELEEDRQKGQAWFKDAGFNQPESKNFKDIDEAIAFVQENTGKLYILKQNAGAPKHINHKGHFKDGSDMVYHLEECKKHWNEHDWGAFDCDLMEIVQGIEIAASGFFNGHDWLKDKDGKVVGFLNAESKKEANDNRGETTGETGTTFKGADEDDELFKDILLRPEITAMLKKTGFRGVFDINGSKTKDGYVAFEATSRFGIPATSYEFMEGLESNTGRLLASMAMGTDEVIEVSRGTGMVIVITAKPYPVEGPLPDEATSIGERLWILKNGKPVKEFDAEQMKHIHLENFKKENDNYYVATKDGYLLTVTGQGKTVKETRESLIDYIDENLYISGLKIRSDIGKDVENFL